MAGRLGIHQAILACHVSLLFGWLQTAYAHVEPPTNVTFRCHNLHDLLEWSYNQLEAGLRFRVEILSLKSPPVEVWVDPPALHANLSLRTNPLDDHLLSVTAVVGKNESAPVDGIKFSYNKYSLAKHKCSVDFPPVAVDVDLNGHILFQFEHPWLLYGFSLPQGKFRQKKSNEEKMSDDAPEFSYTAKSQYLEEKFDCDTNVCEGKLAVDLEQVRQCLDFEGEVKMLSVRGSQQYCASPITPMPHEKNKDVYITAGVLTTVAVIALALVAFIVYKKKTIPSAFSPNSMKITSQRKPGTLNLPKDVVSVPEVDARSPSPLLRDEGGYGDVTPLSTEPDPRFPLGVKDEEAGVECSEGSEYMQGSELEAAPINGSGYEQRPVVRVELGPGEAAEGYRLGGL